MDKIIEHRIGGWMERALEICGSKNVTVRITKSMTENAEYTEYSIIWKKKL